MDIGDTVTVYHYRRDLDNKAMMCSLGCKHRVTYHEAKRITVVEKRRELIPYLAYTHDAYGDVFDAVDTQGRIYTFTPTWDGPGVWMRTDKKAFWKRPVVRMDAAFTLDNKRIN
jgi:hypothetical protein